VLLQYTNDERKPGRRIDATLIPAEVTKSFTGNGTTTEHRCAFKRRSGHGADARRGGAGQAESVDGFQY